MSIIGQAIQLEPSLASYDVSTTLGPFTIKFVVRWNARDGLAVADGGPGGAWYFDMYDEENTLMAANCKIVLGARIGRLSQHRFFETWQLTAIDTAKVRGRGREATFDDIGRRVQLMAFDLERPFG